MKIIAIILFFFWPFTFEVSRAEETYQGYGAVKLMHVSNYEVKDYGLNAGFVGGGFESQHVEVFAGIGYHDEEFDCHRAQNGVCFGGNSLGIIELTIKW